jgi:phenylalanyl-tRNA synthetase beta chain
MNISYNWLKDLIDLDLSVEETAKELTRVGLAVEGIHPFGDDHVLDVDLTSNRPDCLSHLGIARELSVITGKDLKPAAESNDIPVPATLAAERVVIEDPDLCNRFTARIIRGVKVGPSPEWLVKRLEALGERSINNVADITNYVMLELGQPMHAFDLDKLSGNRIVVRRALKGESLVALDELDHELNPSVLAICDAERPVAIAGVIGGLESSITDETVNVLLEVAYFNRQSIRNTSRALGIATEASYRFERGVDVQNLKRASDRAADLICELAGGEKGEFYDLYPQPQPKIEVKADDLTGSVKRLTGLAVSMGEADNILNALGITAAEREAAYVAPSWRHDISIAEDLVEEVARHVGYEKIASEYAPAFAAGEYQPGERRKRSVRQLLANAGFNEAITYSFIDTENDARFEPVAGLAKTATEKRYVELRDSVIEGAVRMRPSLLPGLLDAVRTNFNQQQRDVRFFEIGRVFTSTASENELPQEAELLGIAVTGSERYEAKVLAGRDVDFFDAKGALEAALDGAGCGRLEFRDAEIIQFRRGQTAEIVLNGNVIGHLGRLNDDLASVYKFKQPVFVGEVDLGRVLAADPPAALYEPLGRFPAITRDVSLIGSRGTGWTTIKAAVEEMGFGLCRSVELVDTFEGKGMSENERSVTLRLEYRSDERTLADDDINDVHAAILKQLDEILGLKPRV